MNSNTARQTIARLEAQNRASGYRCAFDFYGVDAVDAATQAEAYRLKFAAVFHFGPVTIGPRDLF